MVLKDLRAILSLSRFLLLPLIQNKFYSSKVIIIKLASEGHGRGVQWVEQVLPNNSMSLLNILSCGDKGFHNSVTLTLYAKIFSIFIYRY